MKESILKGRLAAFVRQVWNDGDVDAAEGYLAPRYTIHHDPGDPWEGRVLDMDGSKDRVRLSRAPFPDQTFEIQGLYADGDAVVMTWLWNATHRADIPGFAATGKSIRMSGATTYFFTLGERVSGHWQITDRLGVFQQLQRHKVTEPA